MISKWLIVGSWIDRKWDRGDLNTHSFSRFIFLRSDFVSTSTSYWWLNCQVAIIQVWLWKLPNTACKLRLIAMCRVSSCKRCIMFFQFKLRLMYCPFEKFILSLAWRCKYIRDTLGLNWLHYVYVYCNYLQYCII